VNCVPKKEKPAKGQAKGKGQDKGLHKGWTAPKAPAKEEHEPGCECEECKGEEKED